MKFQQIAATSSKFSEIENISINLKQFVKFQQT